MYTLEIGQQKCWATKNNLQNSGYFLNVILNSGICLEFYGTQLNATMYVFCDLL